MKSEKELELPDELVENEVAEVAQTAAEQEEQAEEERVLSGLEKMKQLDEEDTRVKVSLRTILGGDILTGSWFRKNFFFILFLVGLTIIYISNRYAYQQEQIEATKLADTLLDRRYKSLTRSSQLLEKTLRSRVEGDLLDSTLQTAMEPSYILKTSDE